MIHVSGRGCENEEGRCGKQGFLNTEEIYKQSQEREKEERESFFFFFFFGWDFWVSGKNVGMDLEFCWCEVFGWRYFVSSV